MKLESAKEIRKHSITVGFLYETNKTRLKLVPLTNVGFENTIRDKSIHRPGLALAGYVALFTYDRVQVFGNTEIRYLNSMLLEERIKAFNTLFKFAIPCIFVTNDNPIDQELVQLAADHNVPMFRTSLETTKAVYFLSDFLDDQFSPQTTIHGSFVDVYGLGLLFIGRSGIGKSEIALDLISERGHRLVSDDVCERNPKRGRHPHRSRRTATGEAFHGNQGPRSYRRAKYFRHQGDSVSEKGRSSR